MEMMEEIVVEKGIPLPTGARAAKYPFASMEVGDSFVVAGSSKQLARSHALNYKKLNPGWNYRTRTTSDGMRIWRVS